MAKGNIITRTKKQKAITAFQQNNLHEAKKLLEQVYQRDRRDLEALFMLGVVSGILGQHSDAEKAFLQITRLAPDNVDAHNNLGLALEGQGRSEEAVSSFQNALRINPDSAELHFNLANSLQSLSCHDEAIEHYQAANILQPDNPDIHANLGHALQEQGRLEEAIDTFQCALAINPEHAVAWNNLGNVYKKQKEACRAIDAYQQALKINPGYSEAQHNLGNACLQQGRIDEALSAYRQVVELRPQRADDFSTLLFSMNYSPAVSNAQLFEEHRNYQKRYAISLSKLIKAHTNDCTAGRRLRVGYVSPDLYNHSVAFFIEPVLEQYDRGAFEVYCYADVTRSDETTERLRGYATHWRDIAGQSDEAVTDLIRRDGIDILVDLAGHTLKNRLPVFARKPAPVQVTWLGYPNTTGLSGMDYRLTDEWADPQGQEQYYSEQLVRLAEGFLCYRPLDDSPVVSPLPMTTAGHVTFGSFNNLSKMVPEVIALWSRLLLAIPGSRLILKNRSLCDASVGEYMLAQFKQRGVSSDRLELIGWLPNKGDHLGLYGRIDIGLDTFPYNGTTTTCEALWMGVPVITLCGDRHAARVGTSLLHQLGLEELIAHSQDEYLEIAGQLVGDNNRLLQLRSGLRESMQQSSLCNAREFASVLENAYKEMWQSWCDRKGGKV